MNSHQRRKRRRESERRWAKMWATLVFEPPDQPDIPGLRMSGSYSSTRTIREAIQACDWQVEPHTCPYLGELYGDEDTLCVCCDECTKRCVEDI